MQQTRQAMEVNKTGLEAMNLAELAPGAASLAETPDSGDERERVETVVETLTHLHGESDSLAAVAHDARNMVTALGLYCDLLEAPGVLTPSSHHYAGELRLVATASRRLVEKLLALDRRLGQDTGLSRPAAAVPVRPEAGPSAASRQERACGRDLLPAQPVDNLAAEVLANRNLLAALAGPAIALTVDVEGGALPVRLTGEELTRILVNLVKNAAEAMPSGGRIQLSLRERFATGRKAGVPHGLSLTVEDNGAGIPGEAIEKIFESGYTTRSSGALRPEGLPASHYGLGLSITRSIVERAGGRIHAANRVPAGSRFEIELPVRSR